MASTLSLQIQAEPTLYWPVEPVEVISIPNVQVEYSGKGMEYELRESSGSCESFVRRRSVGKKKPIMLNVFGKDSQRAGRLEALAEIDASKERHIVQWAKKFGLLGFRPRGSETEDILFSHEMSLRFFVNTEETQGVKGFTGEPVTCFRIACQRAKKFWNIWEALQALYPPNSDLAPITTHLSLQTVKSDPVQRTQLRYPSKYQEVYIGEECVMQRPEKPQNIKDWRELATDVLTHHFLDPFIAKEVTLRLRVQPQNTDWSEIKEAFSPSRDFRPKPIWEISTMLSAMYVRHFMAMREFRGCKMCGQDISHKRADADYCSENCRVKVWSRKQAKSKTP